MEQVWDAGEAIVREVLESLNRSSDRDRAYTTVMTVMVKLEGKGLLARRREGRTDVYSPTLAREEYQRARASAELDTLLDQYGDVALVALARQLDQLDPERRRQLRRLARDA